MSKADIAFRTDASVSIGTGHFMRCLTLANALAARGARCTFLCRNLPESLVARLRIEGHDLIALPQARAGQDDLAHSAWLGTTIAEDARHVLPILQKLHPAWLVVDHYALNARWTDAVRGTSSVLVIDDLADRMLTADLLVDSTAGRYPNAYDAVLSNDAPRLIGPTFALLRPEFAALRATSLARLRDPVRRILITMGGVDASNATGMFLEKLTGRGFALTAVIGSASPHIASLTDQVAALPDARLIINAPDMATLMAEADLCIGAAGSTAWERCALGLPALTVVLAENQKTVAHGLEASGAARTILPSISAADLSGLIQTLDVKAMSDAASALSDGKGVDRVAAIMQVLPDLTLRPATLNDAEMIWRWRSSGGAERFYKSGQAVSLPDHLEWFARALAQHERRLFVVEMNQAPVAHVRIDLAGTAGQISIVVDEAMQGKRIAFAALSLAMSRCRGAERFEAVVHKDNLSSMRLFEGLGFQPGGLAPPFCQFSRDWASPEAR